MTAGGDGRRVPLGAIAAAVAVVEGLHGATAPGLETRPTSDAVTATRTSSVPRPDPGRQPRPDPRRREVRLHQEASRGVIPTTPEFAAYKTLHASQSFSRLDDEI
jgi:hypothetical protein